MTRNPNTHPAIAYRADIDGLRALAVLAVVLFHARLPGFGGGYVGVDVFFVISGYLITRLLEATRDRPPRAQLTVFYLRRARRILPALLVMLVVVTIASVWLLLPADLARFGSFLAESVLMLGNVAAWRGGGYFEPTATSLLHLWSIAVEEQFYLFYPLLLLALRAWMPRRILAALVILALASLGSCIYSSWFHPVANYYLMPTRGWELLLGAGVALGGHAIASRGLREITGWVGLIAILASFVAYDATWKYPGVATLLPCLGTAALLVTGHSELALVNRLLAWRPLVAVGLMSYSLYLWHAPVLSLSYYYSIMLPGGAALTMQLSIIFVISYLSWKWVEVPLRRGTWMSSNKTFLGCAGALTLVLASAGVFFNLSGGVPQRFSPEVLRLAHTRIGVLPEARRCMEVPVDDILRGRLCRFGNQAGSRVALVWGDSHALAMLPAYEAAATARGITLYFGAMSACRPLSGVRARDATDLAAGICARFNNAMIGAVKALKPQVVIFIAFWNSPDVNFVEAGNRAPASEPATLADGVEQTLKQIGPHIGSACVVLSVPTYKISVPYLLAMSYRTHTSTGFAQLSRESAYVQASPADDQLRSLEKRGLLKVVDPKQALCPGARCLLADEAGHPLYNDSNHLSAAGANLAEPVLAGCLREEP